MYDIYGRYRCVSEVIDTADTKEEAEELAAEYRMAYGEGWAIWVEEQS